jgi:hypothetical protein
MVSYLVRIGESKLCRLDGLQGEIDTGDFVLGAT